MKKTDPRIINVKMWLPPKHQDRKGHDLKEFSFKRKITPGLAYKILEIVLQGY